MTPTFRRLGSPLAALVLALAAWACGGDGGTGGGEAGTEAAASGAASASSASSAELARRPGEPLEAATAEALGDVREATAGWERPDAAMADGYVLFWADPDGSEVRYVDGAVVNDDASSALDQSLDPTRPEILVYVMEGGGDGGRGGEGMDKVAGPAGWRLAAVEYALPKTEPGSTRPEAAMALFPELHPGDWREHPTRDELGLNVKWTGYGDCHYEGGAELTLVGGPGHTYLQLPPGAITGDSWDGPPVSPEACSPTFQGQELLWVHPRLWMLRAWIHRPNPEGVFRVRNPALGG